jgi:hypothetical protein
MTLNVEKNPQGSHFIAFSQQISNQLPYNSQFILYYHPMFYIGIFSFSQQNYNISKILNFQLVCLPVSFKTV